MKLLDDGPDIPDALLTAQERGETLFLCGAGVSKTVGLPLFEKLAKEIYDELKENWDKQPFEGEIFRKCSNLYGQYDRALGNLERRLTENIPEWQARVWHKRIRAVVSDKLQPPRDRDCDLVNHTTMLELSRDESNQLRLVTTNFDTLFERAWPRPEPAQSFFGPALPQPKTPNFSGVLHLHGRIADHKLKLDQSELVLTSPEFADAYLHSGWASRFVYDLARAYTIVLVGYQADDPPMRYMLEKLAADRQRFPDLRQIYAFVDSEGEKERARALWKSKGVVPILYESDGDHCTLYRTLIEWRNLAKKSGAWRNDQLRKLFTDEPTDESFDKADCIAGIIRGGDAQDLLAELNPSPAWLRPLHNTGMFENDEYSLGKWVVSRLNESDMIRACAEIPYFGEPVVRYIRHALMRARDELNPILIRSWEILLSAKNQKSDIDPDEKLSWHRLSQRIREGGIGYENRKLMANLLRPRLKVKRASSLYQQHLSQGSASETLLSIIRIEFEASVRDDFEEIIEALPDDKNSNVRIMRMLERTLIDSLEHAQDVDCEYQSDYDVPSIAKHRQNKFHRGFCPIARIMAELWLKIASADCEEATNISRQWFHSPFLLFKRLAIFATGHKDLNTPGDLVEAIMALGDNEFWFSGARVEVMRGLTARWNELSPHERSKIEKRIRKGPPRELLHDRYDAEHRDMVRDSGIFFRLKRLEKAGWPLKNNSVTLLRQISKRYPSWEPSPGNRDDFRVWHYDVQSSPVGDIGLLDGVSDTALVGEASRIERENPIEQYGLWRKFCSSDPYRAFRGLSAQADEGNWNALMWRALFSSREVSSVEGLVSHIADAVLLMQECTRLELADSIANWVWNYRTSLNSQKRNESNLLWILWDGLKDFVYADDSGADMKTEDNDYRDALRSASGPLAQTLVDQLFDSESVPSVGLGELEQRFNLVTRSESKAGLRGRIRFANRLSGLYRIDPEWTTNEMLPRFHKEHAEALDMWKANSSGGTGSASLFNALKTSLLDMIIHPDLGGIETDGLVGRIVWVLIQRKLDLASVQNCELNLEEIRDLLAQGPSQILEHFAWQLRDRQSHGLPASWPIDDRFISKSERWRKLIEPIFNVIWPVDAGKRTENATRELVHMVMDTDDAFPDAVDLVVGYLKPYRLYALKYDLLQGSEQSEMLKHYPRHILKLANALVDLQSPPLPIDLGEFLDNCLIADSSIANDPVYLRLHAHR